MVFGFQRMKKTGRDWSRWGPSLKKRHLKVALDVPGGPTVKNPPSSAGDIGLLLGRGTKIPHAMGHLSPRVTAAEPMCSGVFKPQLE